MAGEANLEIVLDAVPASIAYIDALEIHRFANRAYGGFFGRDAAGVIGRSVRDVLGSATYERARPHLLEAFGGTSVRFVAEMDHADASKRWIEVTYTPDAGEDGGVRGVTALVVDVTARAVGASEAGHRALADAVPAIVWRASPAGGVEMVNQRWLELTGNTAMSGASWNDAMHPDDVPVAEERWEAARATQQVFEMEYRLRRSDGVYRWYLGRAVPIPDANDASVEWYGAAIDIDDQKRAQERLAFLAEASNALAASLDYEETLSVVARLAVPRIADWCSIALRDGTDRPLREIVVAHADPDKVAYSKTYAEKYPLDPDEPHGVAQVLRTGKAELHPDITPEMLELAARDAEHLEVLRTLTIRSVMIVPLIARGRTLGAISFVGAESGRRFDEGDLATAQELANRAAYAVDNAALYASAEASRRSAEQASRLKEEFLATVSHELRTPLSAILGWSHMLRGKSDPNALARGLETIERNARSQLRIIEDILDVSRIVRGELHLDILPVDLLALAADVILSLGPATQAKGIALHLTGDDACRLVGDPERLRQIIWNLVSNSVKFTPAGGRVDVSIGKDGDRIYIRVRDTGQGIAPDFLPHVFERFRQADSSTSRTASGLGLGLAIVRHLSELHGGTVAAESDGLGHGATFTVTLPVRPFTSAVAPSPAVEPSPLQAPAPAAGALAGRRILVVEDDDDARELIETLLASEGANVTTVASADEALRKLAGGVADLLVSDIGMPNRDGYWLIERVRERWPTLPAVALTAFTRHEDGARARAAGFDHHLGKPVEPQRLVQVLAACEARPSACAVGK